MNNSSFVSHIKNHKKAYALSILLLFTFWYFSSHDTKQIEEKVATKHRPVLLATVRELSQNVSPLPLLGNVTSINEATVRAESSGKISVYKNEGDYVSAGSVIAEFENSTEHAGLLSAEGAYAAAKAGLSSAKTGTTIAQINTESSGTSLANAELQALQAIESAYSTLDDVVRTKTDPMFSNPQSRNAKFTISLSDSNLLINLEEQHQRIEESITARALRNKGLTTESDLLSELAIMESELNSAKSYFDTLSSALSLAIPDSSNPRSIIDAYKTITGIARSTVVGTLSGISGSKNALNASINGSKVAKESLSQSTEGSSALAEAGVTSALGGLRSAEARLEKTVVRSPISGTINSLSVSTGDFVSPFSEIAVVSNNGNLEVLAYATEDDARDLRLGSQVTIDGDIPGKISRIAGALDPKTKKIEIRIQIIGKTTSLVNGQSVHINATRILAKKDTDQTIQIPLSALKITPTGSVVFTVSTSSTLIAHPVIEGSLLGDRIVITDGLEHEMRIVTDARGLKEDQTVIVSQ